MSQLNPQKPAEPYVVKELVSGSGHRYKVRQTYNYMLLLHWQRQKLKRIRQAIHARYKEEGVFAEGEPSWEAISIDSVNDWLEQHPDDPLLYESFYEVACTPMGEAPPVKDILLDIDPDIAEELGGFFTLLQSGGKTTATEQPKSTEPLPKVPTDGKAAKPNSKTRTRPRTTRHSNIEA